MVLAKADLPAGHSPSPARKVTEELATLYGAHHSRQQLNGKPEISAGHHLQGQKSTHQPYSERYQGPAWAARKETPALVHPQSKSRPACQRGTGQDTEARGETNSVSTNRCVLRALGTVTIGCAGRGRYRAITLGEPMPKRICIRETTEKITHITAQICVYLHHTVRK